jgi:hypothetical protein
LKDINFTIIIQIIYLLMIKQISIATVFCLLLITVLTAPESDRMVQVPVLFLNDFRAIPTASRPVSIQDI